MNEFINASDNERQHLTQTFNNYGVQHYEFTCISGKTRHDSRYTASTGNVYLVEAKCRNNPASAYSYNTLIEESKLQYLLEQTKDTNIKPLIFFYFNDNKFYIQELHQDIYYPSYQRLCNETTVDGNTKKVWKRVVDFKMDITKIKKHKTL